MGAVRYTIAEGEVLSENRDGVKLDYVPDPLGSTLSLLNSSQVQVGTSSYWPYGEGSGGTGTFTTRYRYGGTLGYYYDNSERTYVRARQLHTVHARWMTQDPIGFNGGDWNLYRYVHSRPVSLHDRSGLQTRKPGRQTSKPSRPGVPWEPIPGLPRFKPLSCGDLDIFNPPQPPWMKTPWVIEGCRLYTGPFFPPIPIDRKCDVELAECRENCNEAKDYWLTGITGTGGFTLVECGIGAQVVPIIGNVAGGVALFIGGVMLVGTFDVLNRWRACRQCCVERNTACQGQITYAPYNPITFESTLCVRETGLEVRWPGF